MADNNGKNQSGQQNSTQKQPGLLTWSQPVATSKPVQTNSPTTTQKNFSASSERTYEQGVSSRRSILLFVFGVIVGGLLAWSWFSLVSDDSADTEGVSQNAPTAQTGAATTSGTLPGSSIGKEALVVPSPQDAGRSVMISSASVTEPTWVVIYDDKGDVRGNALGAALFFPQGGPKSVKLLRATVSGKSYLVGRHVDNGDKQFSITKDKPVVNGAGVPVYAEFRTR